MLYRWNNEPSACVTTKYFIGRSLPKLYGGKRGGIILSLSPLMPPFDKLRLSYLGRHTVGELSEVAGTNINRLKNLWQAQKAM